MLVIWMCRETKWPPPRGIGLRFYLFPEDWMVLNLVSNNLLNFISDNKNWKSLAGWFFYPKLCYKSFLFNTCFICMITNIVHDIGISRFVQFSSFFSAKRSCLIKTFFDSSEEKFQIWVKMADPIFWRK